MCTAAQPKSKSNVAQSHQEYAEKQKADHQRVDGDNDTLVSTSEISPRQRQKVKKNVPSDADLDNIAFSSSLTNLLDEFGGYGTNDTLHFNSQNINDHANKNISRQSELFLQFTSVQSTTSERLQTSKKCHLSNQLNYPQKIDRSHPKSFHKIDDSLLHRTIRDAGRWAYGTVLAELWALSEDQTQLFRPEGGWWVDPVYHQDCHNNSKQSQCDLCDLIDPSSSKYVAPGPLAPGDGLAGVLWSEAQNRFASSFPGSFREKLTPNMRRSFTQGIFPLKQNNDEIFAAATGIPPPPDPQKCTRRVIWRKVKAIADDPNQPWNPRLQLMASLGLGWAAAVTFQMHGSIGMVLYMARDNVDLHRLLSKDNEMYLTAAADLAGAAYVFRNPRRKISVARRAELDSVLQRVRIKILRTIRSGKSLQELVKEKEVENKDSLQEEFRRNNTSPSTVMDASSCRRLVTSLQKQAITTLKKSRGAGVHPPPSSTWLQAMITCFGVFVTMLILTYFNNGIMSNLGSDYSMAMGPFGAFIALLFGLTAAPASQPRNAIYGQILGMSAGIVLSYTHLFLSLPIRQSIAAALSISAMAKLGVMHPPAGASALIFASGDYGWGNAIFMLCGNMIAIGLAILINNLSNKRQYPNYWGLPMLEFLGVELEIEVRSFWKTRFKPYFWKPQFQLKKPRKGCKKLEEITQKFKNPEIEIIFSEVTPATEEGKEQKSTLIEI